MSTSLLVLSLFLFSLTFNTHSAPNEADIGGKKCHEGEKLTAGRGNSDKVTLRFFYVTVSVYLLLHSSAFSLAIFSAFNLQKRTVV